MQILGPKRLNRALGRNLLDKGGATDLFSSASLDLRFALQKTLDPRVTFTRASTGTFVGSDGTLRSAVTNLLTGSEAFDGSPWTKNNSCTITNDATASPTGTLTADQFNGAAISSTGVFAFPATASGAVYTFSIYIKNNLNATSLRLGVESNPSNASVTFNAATGTITSVAANVTSSSVQFVGNGWYRVVLTYTATGTSAGVVIYSTSGAVATWFAWGAQLEQSSTVGEYIPTTSVINSAPRFDHNPTTGESLGLLAEEARTNLLLRSEEFDNAGWTKIRSTISTNATIAPNGTTTADKFIEDTTASNTHIMVQGASVASGTIYTATFYLKAGERTSIYLSLSVSFAGGTDALFNASTGVATNLGVTSCSMTLVNNGWYRCVATATANATGTGNVNFYSYNGSTIVYTGDGTSGIFLWGAQLEAGASPTSYIPTTTATATRAADVASITGSNFGTTRTNLLLRSEELNNASWNQTASSVSANAIASPFGTTTADKLTEDSALAQHYIWQLANVTASSSYTISIYAKAAERSEVYLSLSTFNSAFLSGVDAYFTLSSGTIRGLGANATAQISSAGNGWYRCSVSGTAQITTAALINAAATSNGTTFYYTGDGTSGIYLWGAQLETGSTATAYIPTTTAAVSVFESSFYNQTEGTLYWEGVIDSALPSGNFGQLFDFRTDGSNRLSLYFNPTTTNNVGLFVMTGGVTQVTTQHSLGTNVHSKLSGAYKLNDFASSLSGSVVQTDTSGTIPASTVASIGSAGAGAVLGQQRIRRLTYWPVRLADPTLVSITQP